MTNLLAWTLFSTSGFLAALCHRSFAVPLFSHITMYKFPLAIIMRKRKIRGKSQFGKKAAN